MNIHTLRSRLEIYFEGYVLDVYRDTRSGVWCFTLQKSGLIKVHNQPSEPMTSGKRGWSCMNALSLSLERLLHLPPSPSDGRRSRPLSEDFEVAELSASTWSWSLCIPMLCWLDWPVFFFIYETLYFLCFVSGGELHTEKDTVINIFTQYEHDSFRHQRAKSSGFSLAL